MSQKVTVLMPVYNGEKYLKEAIDSILGQTFSDFAFLIINDASTDLSRDIILSYSDSRIELIDNRVNIGVTQTLKRGLDLIHSQYIVRMDCDDISLPQRIEKQVVFMDANPDIGMSGTWVETINNGTKQIFRYPVDSNKLQVELLFNSTLAHPTVIMRKSLLKKFNLTYDQTYMITQDWDLWLRSSVYFPITNIPEILLKYRFDSNSHSQKYTDLRIKEEKDLYKRNLQHLGIELDPQEMNIHRSIASHTVKQDAHYLCNVNQWFCTLQKSNAIKKCYPEPAFSEVLAEKWYNLCSSSTQLGFRVWKLFNGSGLSEKMPVKVYRKMLFFIKCLIKYRR